MGIVDQVQNLVNENNSLIKEIRRLSACAEEERVAFSNTCLAFYKQFNRLADVLEEEHVECLSNVPQLVDNVVRELRSSAVPATGDVNTHELQDRVENIEKELALSRKWGQEFLQKHAEEIKILDAALLRNQQALTALEYQLDTMKREAREWKP